MRLGTALFNPTLVQIQWDNAPSGEGHEFWFPYWITIGGKEKYGQFAPMMGAGSLLELLQEAIHQGFFSQNFLKQLNETITEALASKMP